MAVLDVGCGLHPRGDVNVDLFLDSTHRKGGNGPKLNPMNIQNFIQADVRDMSMFADHQFHTVRCYHLIEHIPDWWKALAELWRVTDRHLIIVCPHRSWINFPKQLSRSKKHVSNFDKHTWEQIIPKHLGVNTYEVTTEYRGMFHKLIPFPLWPHKIRVDVFRS